MSEMFVLTTMLTLILAKLDFRESHADVNSGTKEDRP